MSQGLKKIYTTLLYRAQENVPCATRTSFSIVKMVVTSDIEDKNHYDEEGRERGMGRFKKRKC